MLNRQAIAVTSMLVFSLCILTGRVFSQGIDESDLDFKYVPASHPTFARIDLFTGAHNTTPGLTVSHAVYYRSPTFMGFGASVSQFDGPTLVALFAELRHLPTAKSLSETFSFSLGFWNESASPSDNGFMLGLSLGFTRRAFGAGGSRFIGEIGYRLVARPVRNFIVLAPCPINLVCGPSRPEVRNTHNLVFSLGVLF